MARQSAVRAGSGGFDITTGGHTQLDGALIASTASADKNRLDTGTLGWRDIKNESTTTGSSYSVALSASGNSRESLNVAPVIGSGQANRDDQGITAAAVSGGNILIRSPENQTQDITGLRRETENTHDGVDVRGDIQGIRDDLAVQSEAAALGTTVLDAYSKYAQKQVDRDNAALAAKLESEGKLDGLTADQRKAVIRNHPAYNNTDYGPGSAFWTKGSAAAGLLAGALGGNLQAGAAAGAAPLLASLVKEQQNDAARAALHGIVAAALTQLAGGSSADGLKAAAAGAVTASVMSEHLVSALYGKKPEQLSADEKRLVSNLMSIVGGLAGYAVTGGEDVSMAALAANTARVEVENNSLGDIAEELASGQSPADKLDKINKAEEERFRQEHCAGLSADTCSAKMYDARREALKKGAEFGIDFLPVVGDIKGFAEAESAIDYLAAVIGIFPGLGDGAGKALKAAEKALARGDLDTASTLINKASDEIAGSVVNTGSAVNLDEVNRIKFDPHAGKNKMSESSAAIELQNSLGGKLERVDESTSRADFVFTSGPNKGKTVDFMFTTAGGTQKEIDGMNKFFNNNWDKNIKQLRDHLSKADIVPLDFRNLNIENQQKLLNHINTLSQKDKLKIVIMR